MFRITATVHSATAAFSFAVVQAAELIAVLASLDLQRLRPDGDVLQVHRRTDPRPVPALDRLVLAVLTRQHASYLAAQQD